jgi:hypothetical protein
MHCLIPRRQRSIPSTAALFAALIFTALAGATLEADEPPSRPKSTPYQDDRRSDRPQKIPGRVLCAYYDLGGEGVAYHDEDAENNGSGALNPSDGSYLNEFRMKEGIDRVSVSFVGGY